MIVFKTILMMMVILLHIQDFTGCGEWCIFIHYFLYNNNIQFPVHCFSFMSAYFTYKLLMQPSFISLFKRLKPDLILALPMIPFAYYLTGKPFNFIMVNVVYWYFWQWLVFLTTVTIISLLIKEKNKALTYIVIITLLIGTFDLLNPLYGYNNRASGVLNHARLNAQYLALGLIFTYLNKGSLALKTTNSSFYEKWVLRGVFYYHVPVIYFIFWWINN